MWSKELRFRCFDCLVSNTKNLHVWPRVLRTWPAAAGYAPSRRHTVDVDLSKSKIGQTGVADVLADVMTKAAETTVTMTFDEIWKSPCPAVSN